VHRESEDSTVFVVVDVHPFPNHTEALPIVPREKYLNVSERVFP
jgi:hypothetical protein